MGERTPNLKLYKPSIVPLEIGWGEEVNRNFDKIDELLAGAAQSAYLIAGKVNYVANAVYTNGVWNRLNTGMGAVRLALDPSAQTFTVYYAAAGSNPISWTTLQTFSSGGLNAGAKKITNLASPTAASDAATKAYVDGLIAKVMPYRPETWPTETLDWGDIPPGEPMPFEGGELPYDSWKTIFTFNVPTGDTYKWRFTFIIQDYGSGTKGNFKITANGNEIFYVSDVSGNTSGKTWTYDVIIPAGSTVTIQGSTNKNIYYKVLSGSNVQNLGFVCGPKTFNLAGKWLALGLDMKGLAATVKINGVEMPYSDYAKYFPLAPTEITISGTWTHGQARPVIKRYV